MTKNAYPRGTGFLFASILLVLATGVSFIYTGPLGNDGPIHTRAEDFLPALWPEQWRDELVAAQERVDDRSTHWRLNPEETALTFVREVMQWDKISKLEVCTPDVAVSCGSGTAFAVSRSPGSPPLFVTLSQLGRTGEKGIWSVTSVQGPRVFLDIRPGATVRVGDDLQATTTLKDRDYEYLRGGSDYWAIPGGCGGGGAGRAEVSDGTIDFAPQLWAVDCYSEGPAIGASFSSGERLQTAAVGFVFVALDRELDSIGFALDATMPRDMRADFVGPGPVQQLAAVPVLFAPKAA